MNKSLHALVQKVKEQNRSLLTFNVADLEVGNEAKSGNIGFRVVCTNGKAISFWSSNMDEVVEETSTEGIFQVRDGVKLTDRTDSDGYYGLIPADAQGGGYWK